MKNEFGLRLGIVIIGFKNAEGISRLLTSLNHVKFSNDELILIFSIDYSGDTTVEQIAKNYEWTHGEKIVKAYDKNLGLKTHILKCGDYIDEYSLDAIMVLEDDIYLSPNAYSYMLNTVAFYKDDERIAGISLYKHEFNINAKHPFIDYKDSNDVYFVQYAQSWGQIWMKNQWRDFKNWYLNEEYKKLDPNIIPDNLKRWKNSWLKFHIMYCIAKDQFFVYPRISLTTNFSDAGTHGSRQSTNMQVTLDYIPNREWRLIHIEDSLSIYDAYFQNVSVLRVINKPNVLIDYYGIRKQSGKFEYLLTLKKYNYQVVKNWGLLLRPIEDNILSDIQGDDICLYDLKQNKRNKSRDWTLKLFEYDLKGLWIVNSTSIKYCLRFVFLYIKNRLIQAKKHLRKGRFHR